MQLKKTSKNFPFCSALGGLWAPEVPHSAHMIYTFSHILVALTLFLASVEFYHHLLSAEIIIIPVNKKKIVFPCIDQFNREMKTFARKAKFYLMKIT